MARNKKTPLGLYIVIIVISVYLFFRFGLRLFVDWAFLITQKPSSRDNMALSNKSQVALISEPLLIDMPDATNEAVLYISGKANPETEIILFHNKKRISTGNTDFEGNFKFEQVLEERNNQFYVKSIDTYSKKSNQSKNYDVTYIDKLPMLEISNPVDSKKYYDQALNIEGETDKEIFVKVNNMPIVIKADGTFSYPYTLNKGDNEIVIIASDLAGNMTEKTFKVSYIE